MYVEKTVKDSLRPVAAALLTLSEIAMWEILHWRRFFWCVVLFVALPVMAQVDSVSCSDFTSLRMRSSNTLSQNRTPSDADLRIAVQRALVTEEVARAIAVLRMNGVAPEPMTDGSWLYYLDDWVDTYCEKNPDMDVVVAGQKYVLALLAVKTPATSEINGRLATDSGDVGSHEPGKRRRDLSDIAADAALRGTGKALIFSIPILLLIAFGFVWKAFRRLNPSRTEDRHFESASMELDGEGLNKGMWARLYAKHGGDEAKTRAAYIRERTKELSESARSIS